MEINGSGRLLGVLHSHRLTIKLKEWLYHTENVLMAMYIYIYMYITRLASNEKFSPSNKIRTSGSRLGYGLINTPVP